MAIWALTVPNSPPLTDTLHFGRLYVTFCFVIGDYRSAMILCRDDCPSNPFPVALRTAVHCLHFCVMIKGTPLLDMHTNEPVVDRFGNKMICVGIWTALSTAINFKSALAKVCSHYDTTKGEFYTPCLACESLANMTPNPGCTIHGAHGRPQLAYSGCVTNSEEFKNISKIEEYIVDHYKERSTFQLVPKMLQVIRTACLASNDLYSLMIWTMMIVGIKLFARIDESFR
jgi:hypothetical protein